MRAKINAVPADRLPLAMQIQAGDFLYGIGAESHPYRVLEVKRDGFGIFATCSQLGDVSTLVFDAYRPIWIERPAT